MEYKRFKIGEIVPYDNNPRINDWAVQPVMESIRQCGYVAPIVIDDEKVVLAGHTRLEALRGLGFEEVECVVVPGLSEEQKKKFRLLDNKTNELAEWDEDLLKEELEDLDLGGIHWFDDLLNPDVAELSGGAQTQGEKKPADAQEDDGVIVCPRCGAVVETQKSSQNEVLEDEPINWSSEE